VTDKKKESGKLIVISAPSGAGKGTVISLLRHMEPSLKYSVSATTRTPRSGEIDGVHYFFVSNERFEEMIRNGEFLEYADYVGKKYGTPAGPIKENKIRGSNTILEIDLAGARQVRAHDPEAVMIFLAPPSAGELERRLRSRGGASEEEIKKRLEASKKEMKAQSEFDYIVINDIAERAAREILDIIKGEQAI